MVFCKLAYFINHIDTRSLKPCQQVWIVMQVLHRTVRKGRCIAPFFVFHRTAHLFKCGVDFKAGGSELGPVIITCGQLCFEAVVVFGSAPVRMLAYIFKVQQHWQVIVAEGYLHRPAIWAGEADSLGACNFDVRALQVLGPLVAIGCPLMG